MIKGISFLRPAEDVAAFEQLSGFFSALGFAPGKGEPAGRSLSFLAPMGDLEFVEGLSVPADVIFEVTSLDAAHQACAAWMKANNVAAEKLSAISSRDGQSSTDEKKDLFTVEPVSGHSFSFWAWSNPVKGKPVAIEGDLSAEGMKFAIVVARWNAVITDRLLEAALDALLRSGAAREEITIVRVPGAWEVPQAARTLANQGHVDAIITLGCLLRGETAHYEAIYNEVSRGIGQSQQETGIPHSFGVLTCETLEQALNRAGIKAGNKGFEAAIAAIEMVSVTRRLKEGGKA